jgi:uncharacterized protein (TIGR02246 family)
VARTTEAVVADHLRALNAGDLDAIAADYADDAVLLAPGAALTGGAAIRQAFASAVRALPDAVYTERSLQVSGDAALLEWSRHSATTTSVDGVDTFVVRDDKIWIQTAVVQS